MTIKLFLDKVKKNAPNNPQRGLVDLNTLLGYFKDKRIILVGNSNSLLSRNYGELIDSHDCVVRMNLGLVDPEKPNVFGRKTHIWASGLSIHWKQKQGYSFFHDKCKYILLLSAHVNYNQLSFMLENGYTDSIENYIELVERFQSKPSTGAMTINFLMNSINNFSSLSLVGFDFFKTKTWYNPDDKYVPHNSNGNEEKFIKNHIESGRIAFHA